MKYIFLLLAGAFLVSCAYAQSARADMSVTSVTMEGRDYAWAPKKLVPPKTQSNEPVNVSTSGREFPVTNQPAEPPLPFIKCTITVQNAANNDPAHEVVVLLVLPGEVAGQSNSPTAVPKKISPSSPHPGHIQFNLGQIPSGQSRTVDFLFNRSHFFPNKVSVFVAASSSDPNPGNNYKEASY